MRVGYNRTIKDGEYASRFLLEPETLAYLALNATLTPDQIVALNANIRAVKYSTGVALTAVTCNLSLASGYYFLTNSSVDLRPYALISGVQFSVSDGSNAAVFSGTMTLGTGETLGTNLVTNPTAEGTYTAGVAPNFTLTRGTATEHLSPHGGTSSQMISNPAGNTGLVRANMTNTSVLGGLHKLTFWGKCVAGSGAAGVSSNAQSAIIVPSFSDAAWAQHSAYLTLTSVGAGSYVNLYAATNASADVNQVAYDDIYFYPVTAPNTTGFSSAALTDAGINPNSASYVITITRP